MAKVSIITVVKDHASGLTKTYVSLLGQTLAEWEMIIVVGESTDKTLSAAKELQSYDSRVRILEQQGEGIYNAMNQGLALANSEFIWFMNAGDIFATFSVLAHSLNKMNQGSSGLLVGGYQIYNGSPRQIYSFSGKNMTILDFAFTRRGGCHQSMIFRTKSLKYFRGFDTSYSLAADFDLVLKVVARFKAERVSEIYATIEPGGRADQEIFIVHKQKHKIRMNLLGGPLIFISSVMWTILARIKILIRKVILKFFQNHL